MKNFLVRLIFVIILITLIIFIIFIYENSSKNFQSKNKNDKSSSTINSPTLTLYEASSKKDSKISLVKVIDGDTFEVNIEGTNQKIRLIGVNTPEMNDDRKSVRCFAEEAKKFTEKLLNQSKFNLEIDPSQSNRDKYNRLLRYTVLNDKRNLSKIIIEEGYGYEYTYQIPYKYQQEFKQAQKEAQKNQLGLWNPDHKCNKLLTSDDKKNSQENKNNTDKIYNKTSFNCNTKKSCSQMNNCDEAYFYLKNCSVNYLDNDKDGIPCENICLKN